MSGQHPSRGPLDQPLVYMSRQHPGPGPLDQPLVYMSRQHPGWGSPDRLPVYQFPVVGALGLLGSQLYVRVERGFCKRMQHKYD